eukprot:scaffold39281_cov183-Amphora_coffeaeformis.AAC.2
MTCWTKSRVASSVREPVTRCWTCTSSAVTPCRNWSKSGTAEANWPILSMLVDETTSTPGHGT